MRASTTQEPSRGDDRKNQSSGETLVRSISTIEPQEINSFIQEEYGACWGTLKFEDSLSDYANEVNRNQTEKMQIFRWIFRLDHFFMLMILLIFVFSGNS